MASVVGFLKSNSVSLTNGTKVVTLTGSVDCSYVVSGTAVYINNILLEGVSGTPVDGSGNSTLILREVFTGTTIVAGSLIAFNTIEGLRDAIQKAKDTTEGALEVQSSFNTLLTSTTPSVDITINGVVTSLTPYQYLADQMNILLTSLDQVDNTSDLNKPISTNAKLLSATRSKAEFFAQAEQRIRESVGSGFSEMGDGTVGWQHQNSVNKGISTNVHTSTANRFSLGENVRNIVSGISLRASYTNNTDLGITVTLPPAPDGTKTYDSATGTVVQHASAEIAFAAETATNKVITSRKDFVMLEMWYEKISKNDVVFPLGNVQYGTNTWESITLSNMVVAQGYSAFGEWDSTTKGYGVVWSTLNDADKIKFLQDPENNIYNDDGELIQVRYRVRVIEGLGDEWAYASLGGSSLLNYANSNRVTPRGDSTLVQDLGLYGNYYYQNSYNNPDETNRTLGSWHGQNTSGNGVQAHNGLCFAIPIALVQRRNQGAFHPSFNPQGCAPTRSSSSGTVWVWHHSYVLGQMTSEGDCFNPNNIGYNLGSTTGAATTFLGDIAMGGTYNFHPDNKFYDAIYADDVEDLRVSTKALTERDKFDAIQADISGESRGFEGVPFTRVTVVDYVSNQAGRTLIRDDSAIASMFSIFGSLAIGQAEGIYVYSHSGGLFKVDSVYTDGTGDFFYLAGEHASEFTVSDAICYHTIQTHQSNNPSWTDIIGDPVNIAATFANGVEGQWIPDLALVTNVAANRKWSVLQGGARTLDNGTTWQGLTNSGTSSDNSINIVSDSTQVTLLHYKTKSNPLELADNTEVIGALGDVFALNGKTPAFGVNFVSNMIGKISNGGSSSGRVQLPLSVYATDTYKELNATLGVSHETPPLDPDVDSPAVKAFPYLTQENGQYFLQWVYKEMVWDSGLDNTVSFTDQLGTNAMNDSAVGDYINITTGVMHGAYRLIRANFSSGSWDTQAAQGSIFKGYNGDILANDGDIIATLWDGNGFGDNNQFTIVDGESTELDDNGNTILIGQKRRVLPFFTGRYE